MAAITEGPEAFRQKAGVCRAKKHSLKTDMTPMVDLGFLLISFFVITTQLMEPRVVNLNMPHDGTGTTVPNSGALTVLIGDNNNIFYYYGTWEEAIKNNQIERISLDLKTGLGKIIRDKQDLLARLNLNNEGKNALMVIIKANKNAKYSQVMDVLDEMLINVVKKYAIVDLTPAEIGFLDSPPPPHDS